ncbi:iron-hydroxamate ABC transporter substrate-binding protein [Bacillus safensis]|uniref:iron-hydroxamate ABC transporter substrate-binding protein n=1 Tax=Bacillus safensis TaxID=561879 RepID=UPI00223871EE|nr:iron-hydroxamate ABC transporter substrate-binding protein [Bacillus safensis]MCW4643657.1 iron-hydroxamate ABC transporter substrate-binding protein [Bacillus safensis]MCY7566323.1 iron-hydroxamate ABC transporter substrate-binding protein [Bacillus safensis]MCY7624548.1 iron-hydroxamate ABC transporter substrate-binding protein [Bacillus safensis]MCY7631685.1 iron-hydroxamate ABC transporter substrate-binding protein [Bacillus safensis]MCY7647892.1 iron-hydroxamate ABC transporter substra
MKKWAALLFICIVMVITSACGSGDQTNTATTKKTISTETSAKSEIEYLGKTYEVKTPAKRIIIAGSLESMEDAKLLGVEPIGASTVGGTFPSLFEDITSKTEGIGEKTEPNAEKILKLNPDVILGSTKFPPAAIQKLEKVKTTIPVSHISSEWKNNLLLLGQLTGKESEAKTIISTYQKDLEKAKKTLKETSKNKTAIILRIRQGDLYVYPEDVYFNSTLYGDLGFTAPNEVKKAKAQALLSMERLGELDPDYIFVQFSEEENASNPNALKDLESNHIWKSLQAVKQGHVRENIVDPLLQGGTALSKTTFLEKAVKWLSSQKTN